MHKGQVSFQGTLIKRWTRLAPVMGATIQSRSMSLYIKLVCLPLPMVKLHHHYVEVSIEF